MHPSPDASRALDLSLVIPVYDEAENLLLLHQRLVEALDPTRLDYEVLYVDDGSRDQSVEILSRIAAKDPRARVIELRRNFGQTAALLAGIDHASGQVVCCLDADLQNDPADIPQLLARLGEGYDVVSGWRQKRQDDALRSFLSRAANRLISRVTGVALHDYGCTLKAYRKDVLEHFQLYGEMHRFIPAYLGLLGARVTEIPVRHHPRTRGRSKYGLLRTVKVMLDLLTVKFLGSYATKPIYVFGGVALVLFSLSALSGAAMVWQKYSRGVSMIQTPLLLLSALLVLMAFQSLLMGLISEVLMRTYYESQGKRPYVVRRVLNP